MFFLCFWITPSTQCFGDFSVRASSLGKLGGGEQEKNPPFYLPHPQSPTENLLPDYSSSVE